MDQSPSQVQDTPDTDAPPGIGSERVFYRDMDEFNTALDAASESIRKAGRRDVLGPIIWFSLVAAQVLLYGLDWIFDNELRTTLIPGLDLVTLLLLFPKFYFVQL